MSIVLEPVIYFLPSSIWLKLPFMSSLSASIALVRFALILFLLRLHLMTKAIASRMPTITLTVTIIVYLVSQLLAFSGPAVVVKAVSSAVIVPSMLEGLELGEVATGLTGITVAEAVVGFSVGVGSSFIVTRVSIMSYSIVSSAMITR